MAARDPMSAALTHVAATHGGAALIDPVALRAALGAPGVPRLAPHEAALLLAVSGSGLVPRLRSAAGTAEENTAAQAAVRVVAAYGHSDVAVRRAVDAFVTALRGSARPGGPVRSTVVLGSGADPTKPWPIGSADAPAGMGTELDASPGSDVDRTQDPVLNTVSPPAAAMAPAHAVLSWDDGTGISDPVTPQPPLTPPWPVPPSGPADRRTVGNRLVAALRDGRTAVVALCVAGATAATIGVVALNRDGAREPAPVVDRFALSQVAQRYRELGAALLAGARRCVPLAPQVGEVERVRCDFTDRTLDLVQYGSAARLRQERARTVDSTIEWVRFGQVLDRDAAFSMHEDRTGAATVYWDSVLPRPQSAVVTNSAGSEATDGTGATIARLSLPDLVDFYDGRRFGGLTRPALDAPQFRSGVLADLAQNDLNEQKMHCRADPGGLFPRAAEQVTCTFREGVTALYVLVEDADSYAFYRKDIASSANAVPGSHHSEAWEVSTDHKGGTLTYYEESTTSQSVLYSELVYRDPDDRGLQEPTLAIAVYRHPTMSPAQLKAWWNRTAVD
ncbi:hypothetical protein [Actinoplanes sp. ATCC 53533]|uniref:hypothetical protein n=1 Tax=Actinoplanes sp. ATCC 53533 TaxID=1288362 RepID=UPI000F76728F|nr:hypothetical protein [Actinoplanes sp. ATCC 53533]